MKEQLQAIAREAMEKLESVRDVKTLEEIRVLFLGKKGKLTGILKGMGTLPADERPVVGQLVNEIREQLEDNIAKIKNRLLQEERERKMLRETIDVTMPGTLHRWGKSIR